MYFEIVVLENHVLASSNKV